MITINILIKMIIMAASCSLMFLAMNLMWDNSGLVIENAVAKSSRKKTDLDKEQLRACIILKRDMVESRAVVDNQSDMLAKLKDEIDEQAKILAVKREAVDRTDKEQVDEFNSLLEKYYEAGDRYKKDAAAADKVVEKLQKKLKQYKLECTGKTYLDKDMQELSAELGIDKQ